MAFSRRPAYHEAQARQWQPLATYWLLGIIVAVFVAQMLVLNAYGLPVHQYLFVIDMHWMFRPWTLVTSTLSHGDIYHILFNGIVLFFFGPSLERLLGIRRFLVLFFVSGAIAGILQVLLQWYFFGQDVGGLGASGALMMVFGALMVVMPNEKVLIWGIVPVPFWLAGIGFALLDIFGAFDPGSGVGNFAHLSGMALGLYVGWRIRESLRRQGLRLVHS